MKKNKKSFKNNISNPAKKKKRKKVIKLKKIYNKNISKILNRNNNKSNKFININLDVKVVTKNTKKKFKIKEKEEEEEKKDLNELPFTLAIKQDKRNAFAIFMSIILQKIELINIFFGEEKIKNIIICQYILSLMINFFFNTLLYTDDIVSNKYHNNGQLDFLVTLILSLLSNIITSIVNYFLNYSKRIEEILEGIFELKNRMNYIESINRFLRNIKIKYFIFIIEEILLISCCFYYIVIFYIIYSYSRISLLINYLTSLLEGLITSIIISITVVILRKIGIIYLNPYFYNTSKFINNKF